MTNRGLLERNTLHKASRVSLLVAGAILLAAILLALGGIQNPAKAAFPGNDGKIAFVEGADIHTVNPDGTSLKNLTNTPERGEGRPAWSPDGAKIALSRYNLVDFNGEIFVMNADGTGLKNLTNTPAVDDTDPAWSPDGKKIAFVRGRDIWTMNAADGSNKTRIAESPDDGHHHGYRFPDWAPDGTRIAYSSEWAPDEFGEEGRTDIFVMKADGSGTHTNITNNDYCFDAYFPDWSPNGTKITFENGCWKADEKDIYVANPNGTEAQNLTSEMEFLQRSPTFSPEGTKIAFEDGALYVMNANGSGKAVLKDPATGEPIVGGDPDWQPLPASDTTPPVATSPLQGLPASSQLGLPKVPVKLVWSATDTGGSGVAVYQLQRSVNGGAYAAVALPSATATTLSPSLDPTKTYRFRVRAQDKAGNWSPWKEGPPFTVVVRQEDHSSITYAGTWTRIAASDASGGFRKYASAFGDKATFSFTGRNVAWVAPKGSGHGIAEVWVDGVKATTVDLYSPTEQPRTLVFSKSWASSGAHTVEVRVLGTKNAASTGKRVSVDAFVALR